MIIWLFVKKNDTIGSTVKSWKNSNFTIFSQITFIHLEPAEWIDQFVRALTQSTKQRESKVSFSRQSLQRRDVPRNAGHQRKSGNVLIFRVLFIELLPLIYRDGGRACSFWELNPEQADSGWSTFMQLVNELDSVREMWGDILKTAWWLILKNFNYLSGYLLVKYWITRSYDSCSL